MTVGRKECFDQREVEPNAENFLSEQALEFRKLASEMTDPTYRKQMEDMAEVWEMVAQQQQANKPESASTKTT
jgi:hypothetical protein